jgi:hypothetical protein
VELSPSYRIHNNHKYSNAEPSLTMTDLGAPAAQSEGLIIHEGVMCDECGMGPILGTRHNPWYKTRGITSHPVRHCRWCFQDHTPEDRSKFVAFISP